MSVRLNRKPYSSAIKVIALQASMLSTSALANAFDESAPWQFESTLDKANRAVLTDLIEKKKGGYYDGFQQNITYNSTTNIGSQVNCSNIATAKGNEGTNGLTGNAPTIAPTSYLNSLSNGNSASTATTTSGLAPVSGTYGSEPLNGGAQTNSGDVSSGVNGSTNGSSVSGVSLGGNNQALNNTQSNTGSTQSAGVDGSTACDMTGSTNSGVVSGTSGNIYP